VHRFPPVRLETGTACRFVDLDTKRFRGQRWPNAGCDAPALSTVALPVGRTATSP
jgi:hypothetical protein